MKPSDNIETIPINESVNRVRDFLQTLQNELCLLIEKEDGDKKFKEDVWQHTTGGGGRTRVLTEGKIIEKAGINFSHVKGQQLPPAAMARAQHLANIPFQALGVSVVIHPYNPFAPTSHFNIRFILLEKEKPHWWFGGGFDMTPYYGFVEDCIHWHTMAKAACHSFGEETYTEYKNWADKYFYLPHRQEQRGIGGLFYDDLNTWGFAKCFAFMQSVAEHYIKAYLPILQKRKRQSFTQKEKNFQLYRRGRYVEFNLLYDRGTLFGLQSGGRTESILMSLPPLVAWQYDYEAEEGSEEQKLTQYYLKIKDWLTIKGSQCE